MLESRGMRTPAIGICDDAAGGLCRALAQAAPQLQPRLVGAESSDDDLLHLDILFGAPDQLAPLIERCPKLAWAQSTWAGVATLLQLPRRDYTLTGLKGVFGQAMNEYVLGWILTLERRILDRAAKRTWWPDTETGVAGKRAGIMGTGSIGCAVGRGLRSLNIEVVGLNRQGRQIPPFDHCYPTSERRLFARGLDILVSVMPATPATDDLIDAALLEQLNPSAIVINIGRGNAIVDADLLSAIDSGHVRAAVLDVFRQEPLLDDSPFFSHPQVFVTSHTAAPTAPEAAVRVFLDNLKRFNTGQPLEHVVSFENGY